MNTSGSEPTVHFSLRSVAVGGLVGILLCFSNMYFGLQTGWVTMGSLQSTLVGFLLFKVLRPKVPLGPEENVVLQSTAVATATLPLAAGFVGVIPALERLPSAEGGPVVLGTGQLLLWSAGLAFFGAFIAVPLRKGIILKEKLPFPSGTATGQMIKMLHNIKHDDIQGYSQLNEPTQSTAADNEKKWRWFIVSLSLSAANNLLYVFLPSVQNLKVFTWIGLKAVSDWSWYWSSSFSYMGQGMIMGIRPALSMLAGAVVGWGILGPIAHAKGWAPGDITNSAEVNTNGKGWIMWVGLAIMLGESLTSLFILIMKTIYLKYRTPVANTAEDVDPAPPSQQVPISWWGPGLVVSSILCVALIAPLFNTTVFELIVGVFVSILCSVLAVRALGTTDLNPVSGLAKISQILFAAIAPGNVVANLVAGAVAEAGAQQAGDMMQDLKTGHIIHASPRAQFYGQCIGSGLSVVASVAAYKLYTAAFTGAEGFDMPMATVWLDMADLVTGHHSVFAKLHVLPFCAVFALVAALIPILEELYPQYRKYMPSGVAFAIGFIVTPNWTIARVVGSIIQTVWSNLYPVHHDKLMIVVASGFVLGEGCMSIVAAIIKVAW
eukprot:TRINITY_DN32772_c0_g1_i1.p1 TRINITY_DN32772_c0_g1~~TRINITY_DN32772_c0_g1_i1.p1  ORF type:complete len:651 (-),score=44.03 TRINITY_DN32772_c0_g1_i1:87-1904(-)